MTSQMPIERANAMLLQMGRNEWSGLEFIGFKYYCNIKCDQDFVVAIAYIDGN